MKIFVSDRVENIVGKGENAGCKHFLLFLQCFQNDSELRVVKSLDCVVELKTWKNYIEAQRELGYHQQNINSSHKLLTSFSKENTFMRISSCHANFSVLIVTYGQFFASSSFLLQVS